MKPIKLTIEGINSFIEPQTLDFEAAGRSNLFCICGKTGAGKTTVFDSIMLALYGKSTKGNLADVVNLSLMSARVALEFEANGDIYAAERTIKCRFEKDENGVKTDRRTAVSDCMLYKNGAPHAKGEDATAEIFKLIGLEAAEFKNVYLLEQGEYAEFLKKTPAKQTEAVGKIFSLMRFGDVHKSASDRSKAACADIEKIESEIVGMGDVSPQKLQAEKDELKSLRAKTAALMRDCEGRAQALSEQEKVRDAYISAREKQNAVKNLMLQSDEAKKREYLARTALDEYMRTADTGDEQKLAELKTAAAALAALCRVDREYAAALADIAERERALDKKKGELRQAEQAARELAARCEADSAEFVRLKKEFADEAGRAQKRSQALVDAARLIGGDEVRTDDVVEAYTRLVGELDKYNEACARRKKVADAVSRLREAGAAKLEAIRVYTDELTAVEGELAAAESNVQTARSALTAARISSHAAAVSAELEDGDVCPVCGGVFHGRACSDGNADVEKCKVGAEQAEREYNSVVAKKAEREKHIDRAKMEYENADRETKKAEAEGAELDAQIAAIEVDPQVHKRLIELAAKLRTAAGRMYASQEQKLRQDPVMTKLEAEHDGIAAAIAELGAKSERFKAELGDNCGKTEAQAAEIKAETARTEQKLNAAAERVKKLNADVSAAAAAVEAIAVSLETAKADCPVDVPEFDEEGYSLKREECERLKKQVAENERDIAVKEVLIGVLAEKCGRLAELKKQIAEMKKRADMFDRIAEMTRGKAMLNYVAAEYIAEFAAVASDILNDLSSGKYTMSYDKINGFVVYDYLNGGKSRKTDTLSGGELFLASLSVAIAIARTQSSGNNAFFFLDEGFGTLDEELIDVVYGALESLSRDCLVGVITHAEALIARMPSTVTVVEASGTSGSKIIQ